MKRLLLLLFSIGVVHSYGQTVDGINAAAINVRAAPGGVVQEMDVSSQLTSGDAYLSEEWTEGSLYFYGGNEILNKPMKYDLEKGMIEIKYPEDVKVTKDVWIEKMTLVDSKSGTNQIFINGKDLNIGGTQLTGLNKLIDLNGKYNLLLRYSVVRTEGVYISVLDAGDNDIKISVESTPYLYIDGLAVELPRKRKDFMLVFGEENSDVVKEFIKAHTLNTTKYEDIVEIVKYMNSRSN